jgi:hypothetical protein
MRMRTAVLAAALLTVPLLTGCGGDDDDTASATTTTQASGADDDAGTDAEPDADAQATVDAVQLEAADLGDGWTLTETKPAGEDDDEANPLDTCMQTDIDDRIDDAKVAETDERTFTQDDGGTSPVPAQVSASAVELEDEALFQETYELIEGDEFVSCLTTALEEQMNASAPGTDVTVGEIATGPALDPDEFPEAGSTAITIPLSIASGEVSLDLVMSMSFVNQGSVGATLFAFGPADQPLAELAAELAGTLVSRMPAA